MAGITQTRTLELYWYKPVTGPLGNATKEEMQEIKRLFHLCPGHWCIMDVVGALARGEQIER